MSTAAAEKKARELANRDTDNSDAQVNREGKPVAEESAAAKVHKLEPAKKSDPRPQTGNKPTAKARQTEGQPARQDGEAKATPKAKAKAPAVKPAAEPAPKAKPQPAPAAKPQPAPAAKPQPAPAAKPSAREAAATMKRLRRARGRKLALRMALFVILPTLLSALYYFGIASDQYRAESQFTIQSSDSRPSFALEAIVGMMPGGSSSRDTLAVREYILSREMLRKLEEAHGFSAHYRSGGVDYLSRLPADATFEETYEYYLKMVDVTFDSTSGILTLRVRAFTSAKANELAQAILKYSEAMVNGMSERALQDQTAFARKEVARAEKILKQARTALAKTQQEQGELNPKYSAEASVRIRGELEAQLAQARAQLSQLRSYMAPTAPQVRAARAQVAGLAAQVARQDKRLVNPKGKGLSDTMLKFEEKAMEKEFAEKRYASALRSLEMARSEASRQHRYLTTIAAPIEPDEATEPQRALGVLTVFLASFLLLGIGTLLVAAVREHARV